MSKCQNIYVKTKTFIYPSVIFRFLPNFQRLKKIIKSVKSINLKNELKSNKRINKIAIKSNGKIFPIYN